MPTCASCILSRCEATLLLRLFVFWQKSWSNYSHFVCVIFVLILHTITTSTKRSFNLLVSNVTSAYAKFHKPGAKKRKNWWYSVIRMLCVTTIKRSRSRGTDKSHAHHITAKLVFSEASHSVRQTMQKTNFFSCLRGPNYLSLPTLAF